MRKALIAACGDRVSSRVNSPGGSPSMPRARAAGRAIARRRRVSPWWARLSDEELLKLRFCDLRLSPQRSPLAPQVKRLYSELENRGIRFRPHTWLAEEWFSPDGV